MTGEKDIPRLLKMMKPELHAGDFVFCTVPDMAAVHGNDALLIFKEQEGITLILKRSVADELQLNYSFVASWITLTVHSSLAAVGFTAAFSKALTDQGIGCNVIAAFYHDHIFVATKDAEKAMLILNSLSA